MSVSDFNGKEKDILLIEGGVPLKGSIKIQGSKNAVLPILAGSILSEESVTLNNCPKLKDVCGTVKILESLGAEVIRDKHKISVNPKNATGHEISENLMREMRSSVIFCGALLSKNRKAVISYPGGCELGLRPIDLHLKAFQTLGVKIEEKHGYIYCNGENIKPGEIYLNFPSVGATENVMLLTVGTEGTTTIYNSAKEPEIIDLQNFLNSMGADIKGAGTDIITVRGVEKLHGTEYSVMPDRIVAVTFLLAGAITRGKVTVKGVNPMDFASVMSILSESGCNVKKTKNSVTVSMTERPKAIKLIDTMPYPGFPTDAQAPVSAYLTTADGISMINENLFESRFKHVYELNKMGADITVKGRCEVIKGVNKLQGTTLNAYDLRGAAALIIAALGAEGTSKCTGLNFLDRGYEDFHINIKRLGGIIERI